VDEAVFVRMLQQIVSGSFVNSNWKACAIYRAMALSVIPSDLLRSAYISLFQWRI